MTTLLLLVVLALLVWACCHDWATREIPDWISIVIACIAVVSSCFGWLGIDWTLVLLGGLVASVIGLGLFHFAHLGGGDVKLIAALGLLLGPVGVIILLVVMAIAGGLLAILALLRKQRDYAYVPAITLGYAGYLAIVFLISTSP